MRIFIILCFVIGLIFMTIELTKMINKCPPPTIVYKYVPRTFEEEQNEPVFPSEIFKKMFKNPSPWISGANEVDSRINEDLNKFFITQM